ncbi:hypothetical protein G3I76_58115, partial [Streptomyces sp. SID11233]|nr:hypothetical protein [Streptomyces sp. SID11233]
SCRLAGGLGSHVGRARRPGGHGARLHGEPSPGDGAACDTVPARPARCRVPAAPPSQEGTRFGYGFHSYGHHAHDEHSRH